jgi:ribosomal protein S18 acetylase RimI-like enzyme
MLAHSAIDIRRLDSCSFREALQLWNEGFTGYPFDMTLSLDAYLARVQAGGLSPELSLAAFAGGRPAGFVLSGLRAVGGTRAAWNGGTGVAPEFRRRGVGKALIEAALAVYRERGARTATLEALVSNRPAISLYQSLGYEVTDRLFLLECRRRPASDTFDGRGGAYAVARVAPQGVARLDFYDAAAPWQSQWQSVQLGGGEGLVVYDGADVVAYALYKKAVDAEGSLAGITLYQCVHAPGRGDAEAVFARALREVYSPPDADCRRTAHNLSGSGGLLLRSLGAAGFAVFGEQVHMRIELN